jgi:signal transduction histidine kinase
VSGASGANILARVLGLVGGAGAAVAGGLGLAGIAVPVAALALGAGLLALLAALLPRGAQPPASDEGSRPMAVPRQSAAPQAAPPSEELRKLRAEVERYQKLEQELTQARQVAEAAVMAKSEFLATMSHEIRTPLNGIIPLLDILMSSPLQADQRDYVQTAFSSAKQLLRIVDDILDYSKLEANKLTLESVGVNLREVLDGVMRLLEKGAESKGLGFALNIDPSVRLPVRGDPVRLRQVLMNLVSNAIKFTERGSVTINVTRKGETRHHHELRFEVRDTGVGITPDSASSLFKAFSQADTSTTRQFGGTGLGLVICKRIVDLMGGQIGVESQPGKGSVFWFEVPLLKAVGDMGSREKGLQDARLMILSGDPAQQRRFSVAIPNWGARPTPASNTQEALTKLRAAAARGDKGAIDMLLVDLPTVRTTFVALHRALQREVELSNIKVVYLQGAEPLPPELRPGERVMVAPRGASEGDLRRQLERFVSDVAAASPLGSEAEIRVTPGETPAPAPGGQRGAAPRGDQAQRPRAAGRGQSGQPTGRAAAAVAGRADPGQRRERPGSDRPARTQPL